MFGIFKKSWAHAGVNATLKASGLDGIVAGKISNSLSSEMWNIVTSCTKELNQQCSNLCNSMFSIMLFTHLSSDSSDWEEQEYIRIAMQRIMESIELQKHFGFSSKIEESEKRFQYICEKYFDA
jgi:hypothetical protein